MAVNIAKTKHAFPKPQSPEKEISLVNPSALFLGTEVLILSSRVQKGQTTTGGGGSQKPLPHGHTPSTYVSLVKYKWRKIFKTPPLLESPRPPLTPPALHYGEQAGRLAARLASTPKSNYTPE